MAGKFFSVNYNQFGDQFGNIHKFKMDMLTDPVILHLII